MTAFAAFADIPPLAYDFIMADPPWYFRNRSAAGEAKNAVAHYDCMDLDAIMAMEVGRLASRDCLLWLWATNPMLPQALAVMAAWGFTYKTGGSWSKLSRNSRLDALPIRQAFGPGYVLRGSDEPYLIGTIGRPKTTKAVRSSIIAPVREHSRKPDEAFANAEALMPDARRIELFGRQARPGWDVFGNEAAKFDAEVA